MGVIGTTPFSICFWLSQWILPDSEPGTIHYTKHSDSNSVGGKSVMLTLNRAKFQEMMPKNIVVTYPPLCLLSRKLHHKVHLCGQLLAASLTINWSHKNKEQGTREQMSFMIAFYSTILMHKVGIIPPTAAAESDDIMYSQMLEPLHIQSINFLPLFPSWAWRYQAKNCNPSSFLPSNVFHSSPFPCHGMD